MYMYLYAHVHMRMWLYMMATVTDLNTHYVCVWGLRGYHDNRSTCKGQYQTNYFVDVNNKAIAVLSMASLLSHVRALKNKL